MAKKSTPKTPSTPAVDRAAPCSLPLAECPYCSSPVSKTMLHRYDCDTHFTGFRGRHCYEAVISRLEKGLARFEKEYKEVSDALGQWAHPGLFHAQNVTALIGCFVSLCAAAREFHQAWVYQGGCHLGHLANDDAESAEELSKASLRLDRAEKSLVRFLGHPQAENRLLSGKSTVISE